MRALLLVGIAAAAAAGCSETGTFACESDAQCRRGTTTGVCEPEGCAFADQACTSGLRLDGAACVAPPPGCGMWHPHLFDACAIPTAHGALELANGAYEYDTDTGILTGGAAMSPASIVIPQSNPPGDPVRVISVDSLTIDPDAGLTISGSLPLIIAAQDTIAVTSFIDASSVAGRPPAPGADPASCAASAGGEGALLGTGGGGGGFGGAGGHGGDLYDGNVALLASGGAGGIALAAPPDTLRGGCRGGSSAPAGDTAKPPSLPTTVGRGASGGGAVGFAARTSIAIDGYALASGGGGSGSPLGAGCGAGGGGSGGQLAFDAPVVTLRYAFATGGSGGGGADNTHDGGRGGTGAYSTTATPGGIAGGCGSTGGAGNGGAASAGTCATGGGGGGAGVIVVHSPMFTMPTGAIIVPPATVTPD